MLNMERIGTKYYFRFNYALLKEERFRKETRLIKMFKIFLDELSTRSRVITDWFRSSLQCTILHIACAYLSPCMSPWYKMSCEIKIIIIRRRLVSSTFTEQSVWNDAKKSIYMRNWRQSKQH